MCVTMGLFYTPSIWCEMTPLFANCACCQGGGVSIAQVQQMCDAHKYRVKGKKPNCFKKIWYYFICHETKKMSVLLVLLTPYPVGFVYQLCNVSYHAKWDGNPTLLQQYILACLRRMCRSNTHTQVFCLYAEKVYLRSASIAASKKTER